MWNQYNHIVSISLSISRTFTSVFKNLEKKIIEIENILPKSFVIARSNEFSVNFDKDKINLCSVGRFSYQKNFDSIPEITRLLLDFGLNIHWYIIGYGGDENLIQQKIKAFGVEEQVIILGKKSNPYPFMKACDVYVQPSRYEGKAVTVREAQMLNKPVVITNFATSDSQLENFVDGVIVSLEINQCAKDLKELLVDKELQLKLSNTCSLRDYSNKEEIEKIYSFAQ
jgi:glycosyltransferase involved in cell wall biosynthesis